MKRLTLVRHAKSDWKDASLKDFERPLSRRGLKEAPGMAERLAEQGVHVDLLITSSAVRAFETARFFAKALDYPLRQIKTEDRLYLARAAEILEVIRSVGSRVQHLMLRVSDTDAIRNPEVYLYTVASNLVKEHAVLDRRAVRDVNFDETRVQQRLGELPTLDGQLDITQRVARLRIVLAQLSPKCQAAVILQYRHGLSYQEIAEQLNVSPHMVKKYLIQALAHCRRRMARFE